MKLKKEHIRIHQKDNIDDSYCHKNQYFLNRLSEMTQRIQQKNDSSSESQKSEREKIRINSRESSSFIEETKMHDQQIVKALNKFLNVDQSYQQEVYEEKHRKKNNKNNARVSKTAGLRNLVRDLKVNNLVNNFKKKVVLNSLEKKPVQFTPFEETQINYEENGLQVQGIVLSIFYMISIFHIVMNVFIASLSLVFKDLIISSLVQAFQIFGICWLIIEIVLNFTRIKNAITGEKVEKLWEIIKQYFKGEFWIEFICLCSLILDVIIDGQWTMYLRLTSFIRLLKIQEKIQHLQTKIVNKSYKEHYWGLGKIFLTNFFFAHVLAVLLIMMTYIDVKDNWLRQVNAIGAPWYEQYSWAYYWGTTIMLTVGFGDIHAANYKEAICLTLIETLSCITLAYNINCVGTLISSIRSEGIQRQKKQKILKNLGEKNNITQQLGSKISNYIQESSNIKKKFNLNEEDYFISSLPESLKNDFLRESNKKVFDQVLFFKGLAEQTLLKLSQKIETLITHPDQIVEKIDDIPNALILKQGEVSFCTRINGSSFNGTSIDKVHIKEGSTPILLSYEFILPFEIRNYEIKSQSYSILYKMGIQELKEILKEKDKDFQYFFFMRDKSKHIVDEFQTIFCEFCSAKHLKFRCPRLHFVPIHQKIIFKNNHKEKITKNKRNYILRKRNKGNMLKNLIVFPKIIATEKLIPSQQTLTENSHLDHLEKTKSDIRSVGTMQGGVQQLSLQKNLLVSEVVSQIKDEISLILNKGHEQFWLIESDVMKDYQYYFPQANSRRLVEKFPGKTKNNKRRVFTNFSEL